MIASRFSRRRAAGMTLLELLIALAIFSLLSVMAYRGLTAVTEARAAVAAESRKWEDLAVALARLDQDMSQALIPPPPPSEAAERTPDGELWLWRLADAEAQLPGGLQRVGYRLRGDVLERLVAATAQATPTGFPLIERLRAFRLRYLTRENVWAATAPATGPSRPKAVEVLLQLDSGEEVTRVWVLP